MEQIRSGKRKSKLRKSFVLYVLTTFLFVVVLSATVIFGCNAIRSWLLPESDEIFLNIEQTFEDGSSSSGRLRMKIGDNINAIPQLMDSETNLESITQSKYSVTSIENSFSALSPKRQMLYRGCEIAMLALPALFSLSGSLLCGFFFYKKKLNTPINLLADATDKISEQDLDFEVLYSADDELGALCGSFEQMRKALRQNNQRLWEMLEERKQLQASVAHDLRNPIAIIEGHAEYLKLNLPTGKLNNDKILGIAGNIEKAAKRLESYTESIRTINHLEELELERRTLEFAALYRELVPDLKILAEPHSISLECESSISGQSLNLDPQVLYRILENLVSNALRYANSKICLSFALSKNKLIVTVSDDGCGFSSNVLNEKYGYMLSESTDGLHFGMGLMICHILSKKHGGSLVLSNTKDGGAVAKIVLSV